MTPYFSYVTQFADKYTTLYFNLCTSIYNNGKIITSIYYWSDSMIWVRGRKLLACWTKDWEKRENKKLFAGICRWKGSYFQTDSTEMGKRDFWARRWNTQKTCRVIWCFCQLPFRNIRKPSRSCSGRIPR